jgi:hypothetical protein
LDKHHVVLDCHDKTFTCLDEEGKQNIVKGIPRPISIREILALQIKRCFKKGCQLYAAHVEEPRLLPKREIYFSIDLVLEVAPISKTPYRMSTPELKELQL